MTKKPQHRRTTAHLFLVLVLAYPWGVATAETPSTAQERIHDAMVAALDLEPAVAVRARIEIERATTLADVLPGGSALEWQTEGTGSGAEREANAADSLRLRKEVRLFGQRSSAKAYQRQVSEALNAEGRVALLELAAETGREWLELAAARERRALVAHRLGRLDRAVALHRKRLELGEVAGTEVRQLELQRARDSAELTALTLRVAELSGLLRRRAGDVPPPKEGDLVALVSDLSAVPDEGANTSSSSPFLEAAVARNLAAERRSHFVRKTAWGWTEAEAEVQRIPAIDGASSFETFGFRIAVPLPWGKQGQARRAAAEALAEASRAEAQNARKELLRRLDLAFQRFRSANTVLSEMAALAEGLPRTEQSLAEQFRLGAISYLIYIDGLSRLDELRDDLVDTRLALLEARLELATLLSDTEIFPIPSVNEEQSP